MRCLLVVSVLVAAAGAASVSQRVSVSGSSSGDESVSVSQTSSSINSDRGTTLGTRSSFSSNRRQPVSLGGTGLSRQPVSLGGTGLSRQPVSLGGTGLRRTPGTGTGLLAGQRPVSGAVPAVPAIRPLRPLNIRVPSVRPLGSSIGTRFNNRGARPAATAPALAGAQASLQQAAQHLNAVMSSLGV